MCSCPLILRNIVFWNSNLLCLFCVSLTNLTVLFESLICICGAFPFSRHKIGKQQLVKFHYFLLKFKLSRCKITAKENEPFGNVFGIKLKELLTW